MDTVFKTRVTPAIESTPTPGPVQPEAKPVEVHHQQEAPERIDVYETEKGHKYSTDYFGLREVAAGDWNVKMSMARIDKYVKEFIAENNYDKTTENYRNILNKLETEVNSTKLAGKARIQRILTYIGLMQRTKQIRDARDKFLNSTIDRGF